MLMTFFGWKHKSITPPYNLFQERDTNICSFVAVVQSLLNINQTKIVVLVLEKINSSEESWNRLFIICHANYREHYERKVLFSSVCAYVHSFRSFKPKVVVWIFYDMCVYIDSISRLNLSISISLIHISVRRNIDIGRVLEHTNSSSTFQFNINIYNQ